jgi:anaerobic magnesium-protoporphyrin IX monomethyl ester cyclase
LSYDPDQIQVMYVTPHRWTPYFRLAADRRVIQLDQKKWDYKHQVLSTRYMSPWRVILWVKAIECVMQLRPRSLARLFFHPDRPIRDCIRWYYRVAKGVLRFEIFNFLWRDKHTPSGPTLAEFWGQPQDDEENALQLVPKRRNEIPLTSVR